MLPKLVSLFCICIGVYLLMQLVVPYVAFKVWEVTTFDQNSLLISPGTYGEVITDNGREVEINGRVLGVSIKNVGNFPAFMTDSTQILQQKYPEFSISIPSIKLNDEIVKVESNEFDMMLAQLPGTALPGEKGNVFITGHSSLPGLFDPKRKTIFSNLPKIKKGDLVKLTALGVEYSYFVEGLRIVAPDEVSVIQPPDSSGRYVTLMTCVPPGFNTKRLVVLARLKS